MARDAGMGETGQVRVGDGCAINDIGEVAKAGAKDEAEADGAEADGFGSGAGLNEGEEGHGVVPLAGGGPGGFTPPGPPVGYLCKCERAKDLAFIQVRVAACLEWDCAGEEDRSVDWRSSVPILRTGLWPETPAWGKPGRSV